MRSQRHVDLLGHNDDADGREDAVNDRSMEDVGKPPELQDAQQRLQRAGYHHGSQHIIERVARPVVHYGEPQQNHTDHTFCRTVDRDVPPTIQGGNHPTDDGRKDARHWRRLCRQGNPQGKRQRNQRHTHPCDQVALPILDQSFEALLGGGFHGCNSGSGRAHERLQKSRKDREELLLAEAALRQQVFANACKDSNHDNGWNGASLLS